MSDCPFVFQCIRFWGRRCRRSGMKLLKLDMKISSQNRWHTNTMLWSSCIWEHHNNRRLCVFRVIISCWRSCLKRLDSWEKLNSRKQRRARRLSHIRVWSSAHRSDRQIFSPKFKIYVLHITCPSIWISDLNKLINVMWWIFVIHTKMKWVALTSSNQKNHEIVYY